MDLLPKPIMVMVRTVLFVGGIMGFATDDVRIRDSFQIATDNGIEYSFIPNNVETDVHPNTVDILMVNEEGRR